MRRKCNNKAFTLSAHSSATELSFCGHADNKNYDELTCRCGEPSKPRFDWTWDQVKTSGHVEVSSAATRVRFNETDSEFGCAVVGSSLLKEGAHHFWQIKLTSPVYGRSLSIGIVPKSVIEASDNLNYNLDFTGQGYRLNYSGDFKTNDTKIGYGHPVQTSFCHSPFNPKDRKAVFAKGSIVTVYLDYVTSTLHYTINGFYQGIACKNIVGGGVYPLVYSAAPKTGIRLIASKSFPATLEFRCAWLIRRMLDTSSLPGIPPHIHSLINKDFWILFAAKPFEDLYIAEDNFQEAPKQAEKLEDTKLAKVSGTRKSSRTKNTEIEKLILTENNNDDSKEATKKNGKTCIKLGGKSISCSGRKTTRRSGGKAKNTNLTKMPSKQFSDINDSTCLTSDDEYVFIDTGTLKRNKAV